jgi:hypothetical protein
MTNCVLIKRQTDRRDLHTWLSRCLNLIKPLLISERLGQQNRNGFVVGAEIFLFFATRRSALCTEQFPIQGVNEGLTFRCKAAGSWSWTLGCFQCPVWKCLTIFFIIIRWRFQFLNRGEFRLTLFKGWPPTVFDVLQEIAVRTVHIYKKCKAVPL